jgi:predicted nucleotidyltransferase
MNATWPDLTAKIEPIHRQALHTVDRAAAAVGVEWFLAGAKARDWIFELIHEIPTGRMTRDTDIGIALAGWDQFERIRSHILDGGDFDADRDAHRLNHRKAKGFHIDLVPFGRIGGEKAEIAWPPSQDIVMNVIGFEEAFRSATTVLADVGLPVKIASPAGLMLTKLFAWKDRKDSQPGKDSHDIRLLLTHYEKVAGRNLFDVPGLMETEDYDADLAAARLLGRDVADILSPSSRNPLLAILDREAIAGVTSILVQQLSRGRGFGGDPGDYNFQKMRSLLRSFRAGLDDSRP